MKMPKIKYSLLFMKSDCKGITLIETIIAMAIALVVLLISFSVFSFGNNTFRNGVNQYDIQSDVRMAADYIQNHVRYATFLKLIDTPTFNEFQEFDEGDAVELMEIKRNLEYIYFDDNHQLNHLVYDTSSDTYNLLRFKSSYTLPGSIIVPDNHMIHIQVDADDRNASYQLAYKINLPNMQLANHAIEADGSKGILFSKNTELIGLISGEVGSGGGSEEGSDHDDEETSENQTISNALIGGVPKPVHNATPVTVFETTQYTSTVSWHPNPFDDSGKFKNNTAYRATIIITPKTGYTISGIPLNFFVVTGASSTTNQSNANTIIADFPST
ncbi:PilW family protein [Anoxynatronum sibiricum]|uniref:Prepilin-type N-terminal cleavage/methylation domain-containing protein n=1 Tax=Anoxynatronum sibiricum TaxID=210623 RepID=A0ABU9VQ29_9CLOT